MVVFPYFEKETMRTGTDYLNPRVRYVFTPGGGNTFIRKEDISVALDEQIDWLDGFCNREAEQKGCHPWELYEFINSHYWDAAVLGVGLVDRWRNRIVEKSLRRMLGGVVSETIFQEFNEGLRWYSPGEAPDFFLGRLLIYHVDLGHLPIAQQLRAATSLWASAQGIDAGTENRMVDRVMETMKRKDVHLDPRYEQLVAAASLGREILTSQPSQDEQLKRELALIDRHVWTPHSLGELKDFNYRRRPLEIRRTLNFCERRSHERMICQRTHAFAATSAKIAERLWTHYHVPVQETYYFPPCVDRDQFRSYSREEKQPAFQWLAETTGLPVEKLQNSTLIFETSRMDRTKRKDLLLAAFAELVNQHPDCFLLIGGGPANEIFDALQHQLQFTSQLDGRAFLLGAIPDEFIGPMFSIADIYATASEMEGFGMCASQAASAGIPVVGTNTIPYCLHHAAEQALLFRPGDKLGLVNALAQLLENPAEREQRGRDIENTLDELNWLTRTKDFLAYLKRRGFNIQSGSPDSQPAVSV